VNETYAFCEDEIFNSTIRDGKLKAMYSEQVRMVNENVGLIMQRFHIQLLLLYLGESVRCFSTGLLESSFLPMDCKQIEVSVLKKVTGK
jgi:hypothetical protein